MKIKVCGNTLPEQVSAFDEMGVTFAGFIFYPKSPRYMGQKIIAEKMKQIKGKIVKVGVNTGWIWCSCMEMKRQSSVRRSLIIFR
jgi:phosphoribosylanthranilate isomerase